MPKKESTIELIKKSNLIYNNKYNYSKVNYINSKIKVEIICNKHGSFFQTFENHFRGTACTKCKNEENFINNSNIIHNNIYDYSEILYKNNKSKLTIICPTHGKFEQTPEMHLKGKGCKECNKEKFRKEKLSDFIKKSNITHKNKYDYSKVNYINSKTKVCIICSDHGEFWQTPTNHQRKHKCPKCASTTQEDFINQAKILHKDLFDYSKINYINNYTKINIICKQCNNTFSQRPHNHLQGQKCPYCSGLKNYTTEEYKKIIENKWKDEYDLSILNYTNAYTKIEYICKKHGKISQYPANFLRKGCPKCGQNIITLEDFIKKSNEIHNNSYDYSKVDIINNSKEKITIICREHGKFKQNIYDHLNGSGCVKCYHENKILPFEEFIEKVNKIHNNKYLYNKESYINSYTKIEITCPKHGKFYQTPSSHYINGCPACFRENQRLTTEEFIKKAKEIHGDKYNYNQSIYKNNRTKIKIWCNTCKILFLQKPSNHLNGNGCIKCRNKIVGNRTRSSTKEFINMANKIHNNLYIYSKTKYITRKQKVCIICSKHGEFFQSPAHHLRGSGCPECKMFSLEKITKNFLDKNNIKHLTQYKMEKINTKNYLKFDFAIINEKENPILFIECQGKQHYEPISFFGGEKVFKNQQINDNLKKQYCKNNKIPLLEIPYWEKENIENILLLKLKLFNLIYNT